MDSKKLYVEIILLEQIDEHWSMWFEGLSILQVSNTETLLSGVVEDRPALHGIVERIRDLNLKFKSINVEEQ